MPQKMPFAVPVVERVEDELAGLLVDYVSGNTNQKNEEKINKNGLDAPRQQL
jgi:hypothetical protein